MSALLAALRLMTVIPVGSTAPTGNNERGVANSPAFFAVSGLVIGLASAGVFYGASEFLPVPLAAVLAIALTWVLSGGLHIDGLGDTFDGLFGGRTPERKLEIMSDPRPGAFGVAAIAFVLLVKWIAISELVPESHWGLLVVIAVASRGTAAFAVVLFPYARPLGIGSAYAKPAIWVLPTVVFTTVFFTVVFGGWVSLISLGVAAALGLGIALYSLRAIGGLTGDIYGAIIELTEVAALVSLIALIESEFDAGVIW